jgi:hypothetical protein
MRVAVCFNGRTGGPTAGSTPQTMSAPKPVWGKGEAAGYRMAGGFAVGRATNQDRFIRPTTTALARRARATLVAGILGRA